MVVKTMQLTLQLKTYFLMIFKMWSSLKLFGTLWEALVLSGTLRDSLRLSAALWAC